MTALTVTDPVTQARKDGCWRRDVSPKCRCAHTWNPAPAGLEPTDPRRHGMWQRREGATCGVHR